MTPLPDQRCPQSPTLQKLTLTGDRVEIIVADALKREDSRVWIEASVPTTRNIPDQPLLNIRLEALRVVQSTISEEIQVYVNLLMPNLGNLTERDRGLLFDKQA